MAFDIDLSELRRIKMFKKIDGRPVTVSSLHVTPSIVSLKLLK